VSLDNDKKDLVHVVSQQEFSPLQVQEMNHQRQLLTETTDKLEAQKKLVLDDGFAEERKVKDLRFELDDRIQVFNGLALFLELTPASARNAKGVDYALKGPATKDASNAVGVELTQSLKPALVALSKQLTGEFAAGQLKLRELGSRLMTIVEMKEEHMRRVKHLEDRALKDEECYRNEKGGSEAEIIGSTDRIEIMEREVHQMKAAQSRILEETETTIHNLDNDLVQQRQIHMSERDQMLRDINQMSERVVSHKAQTSKLLQQVLANAAAEKEILSRPAHRTPGRPTRTDKS
jgi:kinetochore protein NDC80